MFLSPQHFQQQERYIEGFAREYIAQLSPQSYGLTHLELDRSMLNNGKVLVRRAKGIFPDGTPFILRESLVLDVPKNTNDKKVYLSLPVMRSGTVDVGEKSRFRFRTVEHDVFDTSRENRDSMKLELGVLNIDLKIEGEELQDHTLLALIDIVEHKSDGTLVINQAFIPQCLHFGVSHYLTDCVSDIYAKVQYRARAISTRLEEDANNKSFQASMRDHLWLQLLGQWMPILEQWQHVPNVLTKNLYLDCLSMAGQMQGLEGKMPKSFPAWDQNELYRIFSHVFSELQIYLREVQIDNVTILNWDMQLFASRRLLRTVVKDRSLYHQGRFVIAVSSSIGLSRLSEEFPKAIKLSGNSEIAGLVRNALSGVTLRHLPHAPSELKSRHDAAYFEVDTTSEFWQSMIKKEEPIALHVDEKIEDINIEFYVIR